MALLLPKANPFLSNSSHSNRFYTVVQDTSQHGTRETYSFATPYDGYRTISMGQDEGFKEMNSNNYVPSVKPSPLLRQDSATQIQSFHSNQTYESQVGNRFPIDMATHSIPEEQSNVLAPYVDYPAPVDPAHGHNMTGQYTRAM